LRFEIARQELHRLLFHSLSELALVLEHRDRAGAERSVVEEAHLAIQQPVLPQLSLTKRPRRPHDRPR
jgi:hypothetical protein